MKIINKVSGAMKMLLLLAAHEQLSAATYALNLTQSIPGTQLVWDVQDGPHGGTLVLTSTNVPNLQPIDFTTPAFRYDATIPSVYEFVYTASGTTASGGGDSVISEFFLTVDDHSSGSTNATEIFFENTDTKLVEGNAVYGDRSNQPGIPLGVGSNGSSLSNSFLSYGSEFKIEGEGDDCSAFGWQMDFDPDLVDPDEHPFGFAIQGQMEFDVNLAGNSEVHCVPEPSAILLVALSGLALGFRRKRSGSGNC